MHTLRSVQFISVVPKFKFRLFHAFPAARMATPTTLFDKILDKSIPSNRVYEDDVVYCFRDIA